MKLSEYFAHCKNFQPGDGDAFVRLVALAPSVIGLQARDIARQFDCAESTVIRWMEGMARPHPTVQAHVVDFLCQHASQVFHGVG